MTDKLEKRKWPRPIVKTRNPFTTMILLPKTESPLAMAMWDFSWLQMHYPGGPFEDWDACLAGLVVRGYNAIRIDCFPQHIAKSPDGHSHDEAFYPKQDWKPRLWGNQVSRRIRPRDGLMEFLGKCRDHGVKVGLAAWMWPDADRRNERIEGAAELARVWIETLNWVGDNQLMDTVIYADILNEYPLFHGCTWLHRTLDTMREPLPAAGIKFNDAQASYASAYLNEAMDCIRHEFPGLPVFASTTCDATHDWRRVDHSQMDVIESHRFLPRLLPDGPLGETETEFWQMPNDLGFPEMQARCLSVWRVRSVELRTWVEDRVQEGAKLALELGKPLGNTEGWGPVFWNDHPDLDWTVVKEAGEFGVALGLKYGFAFNCTSNFTHPQFPGIWNDIAWHKKMTFQIKSIAAPLAQDPVRGGTGESNLC